MLSCWLTKHKCKSVLWLQYLSVMNTAAEYTVPSLFTYQPLSQCKVLMLKHCSHLSMCAVTVCNLYINTYVNSNQKCKPCQRTYIYSDSAAPHSLISHLNTEEEAFTVYRSQMKISPWSICHSRYLVTTVREGGLSVPWQCCCNGGS